MRFLARQELYDRRGSEEILRLAGSEAAVDVAITGAEEEGVSYLLSRYGDCLPATPGETPAILKDKLAVLAHRRLVRGPQSSASLTEDYSEAMSWFRAVARGIASLNLGSPAALAVDTAKPAILVTKDPDFPPLSFDTLRNW